MKRLINKTSIPMYIFVIAFVLIPLGFMVALSFMTKSGAGTYTRELTLSNYMQMGEETFIKTFLYSIKVSLITTLITLIIGNPFAYFMTRLQKPSTRGLLLSLVILPFWTNALVRIYGFIILLRGNGLIHSMLQAMGYTGAFSVLYTEGAVIMGMVYGLLPFMILTSYSAYSKLSAEVLEASRDLGASGLRSFFTVALPMASEGILSGITLVFIPSMGLFFISDLLGGGKVYILGNLIKNQLTTAHNYPLAAAISVVMLLVMLLCMELTRLLVNIIIKRR